MYSLQPGPLRSPSSVIDVSQRRPAMIAKTCSRFGVDAHPASRARAAPAHESGRVERRFEQAREVQDVADRARAVIAARAPVAMAAAPDVGPVVDPVGRLDHRLHRGRRRGRSDGAAAGQQSRLRHGGGDGRRHAESAADQQCDQGKGGLPGSPHERVSSEAQLGSLSDIWQSARRDQRPHQHA
jgi:hypothetical protein